MANIERETKKIENKIQAFSKETSDFRNRQREKNNHLEEQIGDVQKLKEKITDEIDGKVYELRNVVKQNHLDIEKQIEELKTEISKIPVKGGIGMGFGASSLAPKGESALKSLAAGLTAKLNSKINDSISE